MERRIDIQEFFEIMGGQEEAENFFDKVIEDNIKKGAGDRSHIVSVVHSKVERVHRTNKNDVQKFCISTMLIIEKVAEIKIDKSLKLDIEEFSHEAYEVAPVLFYISDWDTEMPDCMLDMMNLSKRMKQKREEGTYSDEWLMNEIKNMPETNG